MLYWEHGAIRHKETPADTPPNNHVTRSLYHHTYQQFEKVQHQEYKNKFPTNPVVIQQIGNASINLFKQVTNFKISITLAGELNSL